MKSKAWVPLYVVGTIWSLIWAFTTWFGDHETSRFMVGWLWLGLALHGLRYALEPWIGDE